MGMVNSSWCELVGIVERCWWQTDGRIAVARRSHFVGSAIQHDADDGDDVR
ncbi:hypothetical protein [Nocardia aurantiaca]|uniref:Uncharacterized protein n=1 Tax=Nocardia aurantiaca TaxID=2675850 RepID=A0A6I3KSX3_9NOCA|nr:hypothetical protein [Nocardia aurantiaca]MTE11650.1 hypothetical protein [Nocardia aurantiaca]